MDALHVVEVGTKAARTAVRGFVGYGRAVRQSWVEAFEPLISNALNVIEERARQQLQQSDAAQRFDIEEVFRLRDRQCDPCRCGWLRQDHGNPFTNACAAFALLPDFCAAPVDSEPVSAERSEFSKGVDAAANIVAQLAQQQWRDVLSSPLPYPVVQQMDVARRLDKLCQELRDHADEYAADPPEAAQAAVDAETAPVGYYDKCCQHGCDCSDCYGAPDDYICECVARSASPVGAPAAGDSPAGVSAETPDTAPSVGCGEAAPTVRPSAVIGCGQCDVRPWLIAFANGKSRVVCQEHGLIGHTYRTQIDSGVVSAAETFPQHRPTQ